MYNQAIVCNNISISIKNKKILKNISFSVSKGEIVALIGPNGAGKTTLLKSICGLLKPDKGEILIMGKNIYKHYIPEIKAFIEIPTAFDYFTGEEFLKYFLTLDKKLISKEIIFEFFDKNEIDLLTKKQISEYSHGKKQKIFLSAIFLTEPQILLLDEPTVALDVITLRLLNNKILELKEKGCTVVISSHDFHFVNTLCERIIFIREGEIVADISQKEIIKKINSENYPLTYLLSISNIETGSKILKEIVKIIRKINENMFVIECNISELQNLLKNLVANNIEILELRYYKEPSEILLEEYLY